MQPLGVVAGRHHQCGCGVWPDAEEVEEFWHGGDEERFDPLVELGELVVERLDPVRQRGQRRLGGSRHRVGRSRRPEPRPFGDEGRHREPLQSATELLRGAVAEVAHLDECLDPGLAGRALGHDEDPDRLDGAVSRLGAARCPATERGPGRFDGVERIGLARCAGASGGSVGRLR